MDVYDQKLVEFGWQIQQMRRDTISNLNRAFVPLFKSVSGMDGELRIDYSPSWKSAESLDGLQELVAGNREADIVQGTTTTGPHRDNITFRYGQ